MFRPFFGGIPLQSPPFGVTTRRFGRCKLPRIIRKKRSMTPSWKKGIPQITTSLSETMPTSCLLQCVCTHKSPFQTRHAFINMFILKSLAFVTSNPCVFSFQQSLSRWCGDETIPASSRANPIPPVPGKKFTPCQVYHLPTDSSSLEPMFGRGKKR